MSTQNSAALPGVAAPSRPTRPGLILAILATASFIAVLDLYITNVGLSYIGSGVHETSLSSLSWVLSAYAITYAALLVPAGRLADRYGPKGGFVLGMAVFTAASIGCGLSGNIVALIAFRVLQAAGGALLTPTSLGLVLTTAPAEKVSAYVKVWFTASVLAASAGPLLGGLLVEASWRWLFLINVPFGVIAVIGALRFVPNQRHDQNARIPDAIGTLLLIVAIGSLALAVVQGPDWGWSSGRDIGSFAVAAVATAAFIGRSANHPSPVMRLDLMRDRVFASANIAALLTLASFSIMLLSVILWMQGHWHYSAIKVGLASAPGPAVVPIFAAIAETLQQKKKVPAGAIAAAGALIVGVGAALLAVRVGNDPSYAADFLPAWLVVGAGVGLALPTILSSATVDLAPEDSATGSAIVSMFQQIGSVIGVSVLVAVLGVASGGASLEVFRHSWWVAAGIAALGIIVSLGLTPRKKAAADRSVPIGVPAGD
ncbi:MFS transporter [Streptomyces sp. NPDC007095]|jgi:EmrB/QacA subfamily drug resistance transporter|uniref:MFS transporter n=1 Tax=Streptomyces sp. NPDC007095 TaxID=3154482 RepID=UPI000C7028CC